MHSKHCANCGNDNDPILTNCIFCKSPLPIIDTQSLSNETLVMNAGQWIGKLKDGFYTVTFVNPNSMLGSTTTAVRKAEIQGYALQYLSLIEVRAISNLNLNAIYAHLKSQYDIGVASSDKPTRTLKKLGLYYLIGFLLIAILIVIQILSYRK